MYFLHSVDFADGEDSIGMHVVFFSLLKKVRCASARKAILLVFKLLILVYLQ